MKKEIWVRKNCRFAQAEKVLVVMRGVSGSGKSSKAKELGQGGIILSTDDFWGPEYAFDPTRIKEAHQWNQQRAFDAIRKGISPIVIDNMNLQAFEARPYVEAAKNAGYKVIIAEPDSPWWKRFNPNMSDEEKEQFAQELFKRNRHGVPLETIRTMLERWQHGITEKEILNAKNPFENDEEPWHKEN